ncbi:hypothetical protein Bhyg_17892 [Pseudolycoriella hygida]|uniref:MARVEL domain-containing protein n=1 Tax=Pseudolycoriella hygida TaxID=35572 RepID=A0A9Q0MLR9_9DIPT|nr:hypothetical protein Bhyg_17892 [Pseudolycoriella hygida]
MEYDSSYLNTTPGKAKISCLTFGFIGLLAVNIARVYVPTYNSAAGTAFLITLILLLLLICKSSLRQSSIFRIIELVICIILTIFYVVGSVDIIRACWHWLFDDFKIGPFIGSLIASICSILATLAYGYDAIDKLRETRSVSTSNV